MKKCQGCHQEIDKYAIACQYCGKLAEGKDKPETNDSPTSKAPDKKQETEE